MPRHAPQARGRHRKPPQPKSLKKPLAISLGLLLTLSGAGLITPPDMIPLPKTTTTCIITGGGTLRVHSSNCGTLWYRGHASLMAGYKYRVTHTGQIAWTFTPIDK